MRQLDKNTFGDSKAEIALAEELSVAQDKATRRKIGRILFGQHKLLESIEIKNSRQSEVIYKFFREYINKQVADEEIEIYLLWSYEKNRHRQNTEDG